MRGEVVRGARRASLRAFYCTAHPPRSDPAQSAGGSVKRAPCPRPPWACPPLRESLYTCEGGALRPCAPLVPPVRSPPWGGAGGWGASRTIEGEGGSVERARVRGRGAAQQAPAQRVGAGWAEKRPTPPPRSVRNAPPNVPHGTKELCGWLCGAARLYLTKYHFSVNRYVGEVIRLWRGI
jgi:hypothetical protein